MRALPLLPVPLLFAVVCLMLAPNRVAGQDRYPGYPEPYDGIKASADSYSYAETRRRHDIRRQIEWNDESRVRLGIPPHFDNTVGYVGLPVGPPAGFETPFGYGYGVGRSYEFGYGGYSTSRLGRFGRLARKFVGYPPRPTTDRSYLALFPYYSPTPQPIGQRQVQTGPNRWESHPVYAPDGRTPAPLGAAAPRAEPAAPRPTREF